MEINSSSNPNKKATQNGGGGDSRVFGYPSSRIVKVSGVSGGKDRHSKVLTSKGLRDRRVRLSVSTAIQFYDLQDRLGYDQPSKAIEWLIKAAADSINELPSLDPSSFHDSYFNSKKVDNMRNKSLFVGPNYNNDNSSSNSETSKGSGSGLSLTRCESTIIAREQARIMASKKENEKSFTDLLTSGINSGTTESPMDYFCLAGENLSFASSSASSNGCGFGPGFISGTLQTNPMTSLPHHQIQRFQQSSIVDGSTSSNFPFFVAGVGNYSHFPMINGYEYRVGEDRGHYSDHHKEKSKN